MLYNDLKEYLRRMNFAHAGSSGQGADFFRNQDGYNDIFVLLIDNTSGFIWNEYNIQNLHAQLVHRFAFSGKNLETMFIVVTDNVDRDKKLTNLGINVWIADALSRQLRVYEFQPEDFFGMGEDIRTVIASSKKPGAFNIDWERAPYITIILIFSNIVMFLISQAMGGASYSQTALRLGADYWPYVFYNHEYYRFFTSMFLHFGFAHLFSNMLYLGLLGSRAEKLIGWWRFLLIYLISGIGSSLVSCIHYYLVGENTLSAGASGAIYGLMGLTVCIMLYTYRTSERGRMAFSLTVFLIFLVYSNFMSSGIDYIAHAAGFALGLLLSFILVRRKNIRR